jgi:E3 ubiquitin-protein ligase HECW1
MTLLAWIYNRMGANNASNQTSISCMQYIGDTDSVNFLDYKRRGVNGISQGTITWIVKEDYLGRRQQRKCLFQYFSGTSLQMKSEPITLTRSGIELSLSGTNSSWSITENTSMQTPIAITISDLYATGLHKAGSTGSPNPFLVLHVLPAVGCATQAHHQKSYKTINLKHTSYPFWHIEFHVLVTPSDHLKFTIWNAKDIFRILKYGAFLGMLVIDVRPFLEHPGKRVVSQLLGIRTPNDHVSGLLSFSITTPHPTVQANSQEPDRISSTDQTSTVRGNDNPALSPDQISSTDQTSIVRGNDNPALAPDQISSTDQTSTCKR